MLDSLIAIRPRCRRHEHAANRSGSVTGGMCPLSRRTTAGTRRKPADHLLLHRRRDRAVTLVEHVRDRHVRDGRPVDRLEVVVHRVGDAADRIDDERERVVVERIAAVGAPEGLGVRAVARAT